MKRQMIKAMVLGLSLWVYCGGTAAFGAEYHVADGQELFDALLEAGENADLSNTVYLSAGYYYQQFPDGYRCASFSYGTTEPKSLVITTEAGVGPEDVVLDGYGNSFVLTIGDYHYDEGTPIEDCPVVTIENLTLQNGDYPYQAAGLNVSAYSHNITVRNCIIQNNSSASGAGGGVNLCTYKRVIFENNRVFDNRLLEREVTTSRGAEIHCFGGGVYSRNAVEIIMRNNVFADNSALGYFSKGGGVYLGIGCEGNAHLINNTFFRNTANEGGGLSIPAILSSCCSTWDTLNLYNNIIRSNSATSGVAHDIDLSGWVDGDVVAGYNNNYFDMAGSFTDSGDNRDDDPLYILPAAYDFRLQPTSPMIDQGTLVVPAPPGLPEYDLSGQPRINGTAPDIGAYEYHTHHDLRPLPLPFVKTLKRRAVRPASIFDFLELVIGMDNRGLSGPADWWIIIDGPDDTYYLNSQFELITKPTPFYQGKLYHMQPTALKPINTNSLKPGMYTVLFGVDTQMNGYLPKIPISFAKAQFSLVQ
jgi:hypothetical protein